MAPPPTPAALAPAAKSWLEKKETQQNSWGLSGLPAGTGLGAIRTYDAEKGCGSVTPNPQKPAQMWAVEVRPHGDQKATS
eukprot:gene32928-62089_t